MRTSQTQFQVLIEYMERNGDLMKPAEGPQGRLNTMRKWEELAAILNRDTTGTPRTYHNWKKVWSDFKSNTRRKAAKIRSSASGTGGGPACTLQLSDLEQQTLAIMGPQSVSGLSGIDEVGIEPEHQQEMQEPPASLQGESNANQGMDFIEVIVPIESIPSTPSVWNDSEPAVTQAINESIRREGAAPPPPPSTAPEPEPARRSARRRRRSAGPRRAETGDAARHFMNSDEQWRRLAADFINENVRLREQELRKQAEWQMLFARCLDILERIIPRQ